MLEIPYDKSQGNNTWWFYVMPIGNKFAVTRCTNGHIGSLVGFDIATDGTVSPSVVCQVEGCGFHEYIKLLDYEKHLGENDE